MRNKISLKIGVYNETCIDGVKEKRVDRDVLHF